LATQSLPRWSRLRAHLCKLPATAAPKCSVILLRAASPTGEPPVVAYRSDGSRLTLVSKETSDRWLRLVGLLPRHRARSRRRL